MHWQGRTRCDISLLFVTWWTEWRMEVGKGRLEGGGARQIAHCCLFPQAVSRARDIRNQGRLGLLSELHHKVAWGIVSREWRVYNLRIRLRLLRATSRGGLRERACRHTVVTYRRRLDGNYFCPRRWRGTSHSTRRCHFCFWSSGSRRVGAAS